MAHIFGTDRSQMLLLPERMEDYVVADNPVRFIDAFVDGLDLQGAGFARVHTKATGRPPYNPADLLKLYIYGYLNRVRSSRRLEVECNRNIEVIWLLRHLKPDFKTIADFRRDNRAAFKHVFREFVLLCRQLELFGRELLAVDGTRIKAVNAKDRNFTKTGVTKAIKEADERLAAYLEQMDDGDKDDDGPPPPNDNDGKLAGKIAKLKAKQGHHKALLQEMETTGQSQISLSDPDSRYQSGKAKAGVSYNVQIAVDCKHKLIVEQEVCTQVGDLGLLAKTAEPARTILGVDKIDVVADRGYFKIEDIEDCEKAGLVAFVAKPQRGPAVREGFFAKDVFQYDVDKDQYICPAGQRLSAMYESKVRGNKKIDYCNRQACRICDLKAKCTKGFRRVSRLENEAVLDRMAVRVKTNPDIMNERRNSVEYPFGSIKQWMGQGAFLMRRLENVRAEFSLTALVYNIRRALNLVGVEGLLAAVRV
jgi:transposase